MKKNLTILLVLLTTLAAFNNANANQVDFADAENMAKHVFKKALEANETTYNKNSNAVISNSYTQKDGEVPLYTIYNFEPKGFVILSAEDNYNALIAFSTDSNIDIANKENSPVYNNILKTHEQRIKYVKKHHLKATPEIEKEWMELKSPGHTNKKSAVDFNIVVAPLTTTKWGQGDFYNQLLPMDDESEKDGRVNGGCVPLAMSQLIKFHNFPPSGNGFNSYVDGDYGELSADFCNTNYNWNNMPDELTDYNEDVATVIKHMGISTSTFYSPVYTATYTSLVRDAFVNHFGFDDSASWFNDVNNDFPWVARDELDAGRPLLLSAGKLRSSSRHCWVVDGYGYLTDATVTEAEYFHMNWGWNGEYNGWYLDNNTFWKPLEAEGKEITFNIDRKVIYNLFPAEEECQSPKTAYVSTIKDTRLYLYYTNRDLDETIQFRYRLQGDTEWIEEEPTSKYYQFVRDLTPDTQYEFQVKRTCCGGIWSGYGPTEPFRTAIEGEICEYIRSSNMDDYFDLLGYNMDTYNLYRIDYNQNGYNYLYGFKEACNSDATTTFYDCYGGLVDISSIGNSSYKTLNRNDCVVPIDCSNNTGTFFFEECDNGDRFYFIEAEDGTIYDPYFPDNLDIDFEEGTVVNFDFQFASFGSPCSIATGGAIWLTCVEYNTDVIPEEGGTGTNEIFETYPFLTDLVDPNDCTIEKIDVYDKGSYAYLNIQYANGEVDFYKSSGRFYCSNKRNYICTELYRLTDEDISDSWACGGTTDPDPDPDPEPEPDPGCSIDEVGDLSFGARNSSSAYLYTKQPLGDIPNQFRYRPVGTSEWMLTDISDDHYKTVRDLAAGVEYEYQMRHECSPGAWSAYTTSFYLTISNVVAKQTLPPLSKLELSNLSADKIEIYPNPATNQIQITGYQQVETEVELIVTDLIGKVVANNFYNTTSTSISLNIEDLPTGIYVAEIKQGNKQFTKKFIKK